MNRCKHCEIIATDADDQLCDECRETWREYNALEMKAKKLAQEYQELGIPVLREIFNLVLDDLAEQTHAAALN